MLVNKQRVRKLLKSFKNLLPESVKRLQLINNQQFNPIVSAVFALCFAVIGGYLIFYSRADTCTISDKLVNSCRPWLGAWANDYGGSYQGFKTQITEFENRVGRQVDIAHSYHAPGSVPLSSDEKYYVNRPNTILLTNWKPSQRWSDSDGSNSSVNALIDKAADNIKAAAPKKIMLIIWHEAELAVSSGTSCSQYASGASSGSPAEYRAMWANVRKRFDAKGVNNVVWVMNYLGYSPKWGCMEKDLWPGNQYVDWVMWDPYGPNSSDSWVKSVGTFYNWMNTNSDATHDFKSKEWGLAEYGIWDATESNSVKFYNDARASLANNTFPKIKAYVVWDAIGVNDSRISYVQGSRNDNELAAYKAFAKDPLINGTTSSDPTPPPDQPPPPPPVDTTIPSVTITNPVANSTLTGTVQIAFNATDDVGVTKVELLKDGFKEYEATQSPYSWTWDTTKQKPNTQHQLIARAYDAAGNVGQQTIYVQVGDSTTPPPPPVDDIKPAAPTNLRVYYNDQNSPAPPPESGYTQPATSQPRITVFWDKSFDNLGGTGVKSYNVYRNGTLIANLQATDVINVYVDYQITYGTTYAYMVTAVDGAMNESSPSESISHTTPTAPDTTSPSTPTGLTGQAVSSSQINLSWNASTDNGGSGVAGYHIYRSDSSSVRTVLAPATSWGEAGLTVNTSYTYTVNAYDAAGNESNGARVTVTTQSTPPVVDLNNPCGRTATAPTKYAHVIWIWMDSKNYSQVIPNSSAPYTNALVNQCGSATNHYQLTKISLANYIGATSGGTQSITDNLKPSSYDLKVNNLFRQIRASGMTEKSYQESMSSNCQLSNSGSYVTHHNPAAYYNGDSGRDRSACQKNSVSLGSVNVSTGDVTGNLMNDLKNNTLPTFSFITPNTCNNSYSCSVATGDKWLKAVMTKIINSNAYKASNTAVVIMYDKYSPVPNVVVAPSIKSGTKSAKSFTHYSLLRTTEEMLGINTFLGGASSAASMRADFNF